MFSSSFTSFFFFFIHLTTQSSFHYADFPHLQVALGASTVVQQREKRESCCTHTQCLKIKPNVAFEFLNFGIFNQFLTCLVTLFDRNLFARQIEHFWPFYWTFVHSKCKRSSLRSQCWMILFSVIFKHRAHIRIRYYTYSLLPAEEEERVLLLRFFPYSKVHLSIIVAFPPFQKCWKRRITSTTRRQGWSCTKWSLPNISIWPFPRLLGSMSLQWPWNSTWCLG